MTFISHLDLGTFEIVALLRMMFLMLCVVFAAAGPGNPGVGDVFSMGPTMTDGAVPHMLPSAADGGAGFVLGGWCSTLNFMSPLYASIAGQMCGRGAQKGIAHVLEGPMAGQASSWARTEGISKIFWPTGKNSTPPSSSSWGGDDPAVPCVKCGPIPGLNNGQGGGKSGRWRWVFLPSIVTVAHLGEQTRMRRWFGGSKYGFSINHYLMGSLLLLICLPTTAAVTCRTCFDQIQGCTGGNTCPFVATTAQNGLLLGGVAAATATAIVARDVFPLRFTRILTRGVLDSLLIIGRRPPPGTAVDLTALSNAQLTDQLLTSGVEQASILDEVSTRLAAASTAIEIARLTAICTTITSKQRLGRGSHGAVASGDGTAELVGVYRYCAVLAGKVVRTRLSQVASVLPPELAQGDAQAKVVPPEKIVKPKSMAEFADILVTWTMLLSGLGIASILVSGAFLREVVFDPIHDGTMAWEGAFELWLVYLEEVERTAGDEVNLTNVYNRGAQDTMIKRAMERLPRPPAGIFRGGGGSGSGGGGDADDEPKWNGSFNAKSSSTCLTFNLGKKKHPANCLNEKGGCKFNHVCDAYVGDKGPGGRCGSDKHHRLNCDNPAKQPSEQK